MAAAAAFIDLYHRKAETVLFFFVRRTFDAEISMDLTAETFAQAWGAWARVRVESDAEIQGWLFTIARRQLGRYMRHGHVERRALARLGFSTRELADDEIAEIEHAAELDELRSSLGRALHRLSADQRVAVQLRVVEELSYREVGNRLGITEATARARVSRGLRLLANVLEPALSTERSTQ